MEGKTLSHYKIISKLGEGGMGEVYLAEDQKLDRVVALKILPPEVGHEKEFIELSVKKLREEYDRLQRRAE